MRQAYVADDGTGAADRECGLHCLVGAHALQGGIHPDTVGQLQLLAVGMSAQSFEPEFEADPELRASVEADKKYFRKRRQVFGEPDLHHWESGESVLPLRP